MAGAPIDFVVEYDTSDVKRLSGILPKALDFAIGDIANKLWSYIGQEAPTKHGKLAGSWRAQRAGFLTWAVGSKTLYRWFVNEGTGPHIIRPVRARALRFNVGGGVVFARYVHHPGTKANPYIDRSVKRVGREIPSTVEGAIRRATDGTA